MKRTHRSTRDRWSRYLRPTMGERLASLPPWLKVIPLLFLAAGRRGPCNILSTNLLEVI